MTALAIETLNRPAELLLIEDNPGDVLLTREAFRAAGLGDEFTTAGDGEEALSMLRREDGHAGRPRPDLILLDLNLPCMDGPEVLLAIRADPALDRIPVILLTSSANDDVDIRGLGADGAIAKPIDVDRLKAIVTSIESPRFTITGPAGAR